MTSQTELLRFGLIALLTGIAIPLAVQLFLVLRNVQKTTATLAQALRDVGDAVAELKRASVPAPSLASQLVAAVPAVIAGVQAFRSGAGGPLAKTVEHAHDHPGA
jgi:hypothetical protein